MKARKECENVLAALSDNGSANRSEKIAEVSERETEIGQVFTFPRHPWTNGHLEGLFGQFSRIAGKIEIDDSSRQALAASIVAIVWRIFIYFHNYSPRKRLGGLAPIEYLRRYAATPTEVEAAREGLGRRQRRSEELRREHPRLSSPEFRELVEAIIARHKLEVERRRAEERAQQREREREAAQETEDLDHNPERVVLRYARRLLIGRMQYLQRTFGEGLRRGLEALERLGRGTRARLEVLADTIRSWGEYDEELKEKMVAMLFREHGAIANASKRSVSSP